MLRFIIVTILTVIFFDVMIARQQDTVTVDPATGNLIIRYVGVVTYARDPLGNLRKLEGEDVAEENEEVIESDSAFSVVFEPGTKIQVSLRCAVDRTPNADILEYAYTLESSQKSKQRIGVFILKFGEHLRVDGKTPSDWHGGQDYEKGGGKLANQWSWFPAGKNSKALSPGNTLDGLILRGKSLPILGDAYVQGQSRRLPWPAPFKNRDFRNRLSRLWVFPANYIHLTTVVPGNYKDSVQSTTVLDTLISYKHQALALKWIDNQGIANSLDQKLENARKKLVSGDSVAARNNLEAFVNEVEAQKDKHLTSEAYALLKFNAQYLIDRLPKRK